MIGLSVLFSFYWLLVGTPSAAWALAPSSSRRDFLSTTAASTGLIWSTTGAGAAEMTAPFCVIGANGKTGTKCVQELLARNMPVRATSRSGIYYDPVSGESAAASALLKPMVCDVTNLSTIQSAVQGTRAVIFAASASKAGGTPAQVDNDGLVRVAQACIDAQVPHLVIVSSGGVSKPNSPVYKFLNIFGVHQQAAHALDFLIVWCFRHDGRV